MKNIFLIISFVFFTINTLLAGQSLLTKQCDIETIPQIFIEGDSWINFPKYEDRDYWNKISPEIKDVVIERGIRAAKTPPVTLTGYDYLLFRQGDLYDAVSQKILSKKTRLEDLILAEIVDGKGRFINEICNSVWDLCAMNSWSGPESQYLQTGQMGIPSYDKVVVDELSGEIAGILSWSYYFFKNEFDKVDPSISNWIVSSVRTKFLSPNLQKYDFFWMCYQTRGVSYQTPWISYNWLLSNLIIEKDNEQRKKSVYKAMQCLDQFFGQMPEDGACTGGAEIWQYSAGKYFQSLEVLDLASVGEIDIYSNDLLKQMGEYICKAYIDDNYFFNYSDCSPQLTLPASLIYRYGKKVNSEMMQEFGSYIAHEIKDKKAPITGDLYNKLMFVVDYDEIMNSSPRKPLLADVFLKQSQIAVARSEEGSTNGFYFGVKGGYNDEFGNQNDAGNFVLYTNGKPLIVDPGGIDKTAKSYNDEKYSVWANQSSWHNLPTINGKMQSAGANFRATGIQYDATASGVTVSLELTYAYGSNAGIENWTRTYNFNRKNGLEINDRFNLDKVEGETYLSFMTVSKPVIKKPGVVVLSIGSDQYEFEYKSSSFTLDVNEVNTNADSELKEWGSDLYRIVLKPNTMTKNGTWTYSFKKI